MSNALLKTNEQAASQVLKNTAKEVRELARKTDHVQGFIGQLINTGNTASNDQIHELQALDHITQSLDCIANFINTLSERTPTHWSYSDLHASQCVTLENLAARLDGKPKTPSITGEISGDLDLF